MIILAIILLGFLFLLRKNKQAATFSNELLSADSASSCRSALRGQPVIIIFMFLLTFIGSVGTLNGLDPGMDPDEKIPTDEQIGLEVECHSGTPLVLEYVLTDTQKLVQKIYIDFDDDGVVDISLDPPARTGEEGMVIFRGVPYRKSGKYRCTVFLKTLVGTFAREYIISFTDFVWGRDNFSFANDGKFENVIDFVSKTLVEWAEDRFGTLSREEQVLLLYIMYSIYKGSIGRCYGFTGGEIFYIDSPQKLPEGCTSVFSIPEGDENIIREMDYVQNDIVFSNFLLGDMDLNKTQSEEDLLKEVGKVKASIDEGKKIILGYISPKMHHSLVSYGYIEDLKRGSTTLVVANNWERNQDNNVFSEDAENLVVSRKEGTLSVSWFDLTKQEERNPEKLFAIPRKDRYHLDAQEFHSFMKRTGERVLKEQNIILMIEEVEVAYVIDGQSRKKGYKRPRYFNETEEISFKKIDYNYVFEMPVQGQYRLLLKNPRYNEELGRYKDVNLYGIIPSEAGLEMAMLRKLPVNDEYITEFLINGGGVEKVTQ
jgi:hypothetical protein